VVVVSEIRRRGDFESPPREGQKRPTRSLVGVFGIRLGRSESISALLVFVVSLLFEAGMRDEYLGFFLSLVVAGPSFFGSRPSVLGPSAERT